MPTSLPPSLKRCKCPGPCPGYGTLKTCPPLIVIAVQAMYQAATDFATTTLAVPVLVEAGGL